MPTFFDLDRQTDRQTENQANIDKILTLSNGRTSHNIPTNKRKGSWLVWQLVAYSQLVDAERQNDGHLCNSHFTANVHCDF